MLCRSLVPALLVLALSAWGIAQGADAAGSYGGPDVIVMRSGEELECRVLREGADVVQVSFGGVQVAFERARIQRIERGAGGHAQVSMPLEPHAPAVAAVGSSAWAWEGTLGLAAGVHRGTITGTGHVTDAAGPTTVPMTTTFHVDRLDAWPGADVRLAVCPRTTGLQPLVGIGAGVSAPSGSGLRIHVREVEAIGGVRWRRDDGVAIDGVLGLGWGWSAVERDLEVQASAAGSSEAFTVRDGLQGLHLRAEAALGWGSGAWSLSLASGLTYADLHGESSWNSPSGRFAGQEDLSGDILGLYAVARVTRTW